MSDSLAAIVALNARLAAAFTLRRVRTYAFAFAGATLTVWRLASVDGARRGG